MSNQIPTPETEQPAEPQPTAQPSPQNSSPKSESDSINLEEALQKISELRAALADLAERLPLRTDPEAYPLEDDDVYMTCDIKVFTKNKMEYRVRHNNHLSNILADSMLPEARRNFEGLIFSNIFRPVMNRFAVVLQNRLGPMANRAGQPLLIDRGFENVDERVSSGDQQYSTSES